MKKTAEKSNLKKHPRKPVVKKNTGNAGKKRMKRTQKKISEYKMPKHDRDYGHSYGNIMLICREVGISLKTFCRHFGRNTVTIDKHGVYNYYTCDIERALFNATKGRFGVNHGWD